MPQLKSKLVPLLETAFESYPEVTWEWSMVFFPDPMQGEGQIAAFVGLFAEFSGAALGSVIRATTLLNPSGQTQETINEAVRQMIDRLEGGRSAQLASMTEQQENALANGKPTPPSGLILPK